MMVEFKLPRLSVNLNIPSLTLLLLLLFHFCLTLPQSSAQEYLSPCNSTVSSCSQDKFLSCISGECQCQDTLNQIYEPNSKSCVLMPGRRCGQLRSDLPGNSDLDPRKLNAPKLTRPSCGNNAICDEVCHCRRGSYHNESSGRCEVSLGKPCGPSDQEVIIFQDTQNTSSSTDNTCDLSLGLKCASDGICKCDTDSIWKMDRGCVPFNDRPEVITAASEGSKVKLENSHHNQRPPYPPAPQNPNNNPMQFQNLYPNQFGNYYSPNQQNPPDYYYQEDVNPFQQLINEYNLAMMQANNYNNHNNNNNRHRPVSQVPLPTQTPKPASLQLELQDKNRRNSSDDALNATGTGQRKPTFIGDRNQFPGGNLELGNNNLWNQNQNQLQFQRPSQQNILQQLNGTFTEQDMKDLKRLQEQAAQLQRLLVQQQQLQKVINELQQIDNPRAHHSNQQLFNKPPQFPNPPQLTAPANNQLGAGGNGNQQQSQSQANFQQQQSNINYYNRLQQLQQQNQFNPFQNYNQIPNTHNLNQYQPVTPTLGPFSIFRFFRNLIESTKRRLFPNLAETMAAFPSPLYIAASTVHNFLPVLRAIDQQFAPVLENIVQLTRPRYRPMGQGPFGFQGLFGGNHQQQPYGNGQLLYSQQQGFGGDGNGNGLIIGNGRGRSLHGAGNNQGRNQRRRRFWWW